MARKKRSSVDPTYRPDKNKEIEEELEEEDFLTELKKRKKRKQVTDEADKSEEESSGSDKNVENEHKEDYYKMTFSQILCAPALAFPLLLNSGYVCKNALFVVCSFFFF
jgi:hypothetical protein